MLKNSTVPTLLAATALAAEMSAMPALAQDAPIDTSKLEDLVTGYVLFNVYDSYNVSDTIRLFGSIRNALDRDPAMTPYTVLNAPVYGDYYDKLGRQHSLGLDVRC